MKRIILYFFVLFSISLCGQQTIMYTQYTFNKAGMNPAASGSELNQIQYIAFGINRQWVGFDNAPVQNFFNFSYTLRPPRSYKHWQNFGLYIDTDQSGLIGNSSAYLGYSYHLLLRKTTTLSFGVYAGIRQFGKDVGTFDPNDPVVRNNKTLIYLYPDIIPGFRISTKKSFMDVSVKQVTITKLKSFKGNRIGTPSTLQPTIFFDYGRKKSLNDFVLMMPSIAVNIPLVGLPIVDGTVMFYYGNRVGGGLAMRNLSFLSAIAQVRFYQNFTAGLSYSYPINKMRYMNLNTFEVMIGMVPMGMDAKVAGKHSIAKCPALSY